MAFMHHQLRSRYSGTASGSSLLKRRPDSRLSSLLGARQSHDDDDGTHLDAFHGGLKSRRRPRDAPRGGFLLLQESQTSSGDRVRHGTEQSARLVAEQLSSYAQTPA
ncbi:hypothetical protein CIHG_06469 [Coccidioides immitis H538.4]|uniref:Uncharacterized protein n=1 Tax=Coccidioides immitis H538.4 TaxID=396776 RepID=A0A0J8RW35_COCIT|nr:hypothetical protein CIHG_06469 [Coccidioides immitis H538.4]